MDLREEDLGLAPPRVPLAEAMQLAQNQDPAGLLDDEAMMWVEREHWNPGEYSVRDAVAAFQVGPLHGLLAGMAFR